MLEFSLHFFLPDIFWVQHVVFTKSLPPWFILEQGVGVHIGSHVCPTWTHLPAVIQRLLAMCECWLLHSKCSRIECESTFVCSHPGMSLISTPTGFLIALEQEVNGYTCVIFVSLQTRGTGCPSPANKPWEVGVAFLCLPVPSSFRCTYF